MSVTIREYWEVVFRLKKVMQRQRIVRKKILRSVYNTHGTLDGLKVVKLLGCVYSAPEFTDQHLVINGASDLLHEIFGKEGDGYHARSAVGFSALPYRGRRRSGSDL